MKKPVCLLPYFICLLLYIFCLLMILEKNEWLIVYTLLYYIYYLNVKVSYNFLPVVS